MAALSLRLEILVPVTNVELVKEMCRIQLRHNAGKPIPVEYQRRFEALKVRFVKALHLPKNQTRQLHLGYSSFPR